jgi:uncharacterized membrane protein
VLLAVLGCAVGGWAAVGCADDANDGTGEGGAGGGPATGSCPSDLPSDANCPQAAPSYAGVVAGILEQRCQGCHYPQNPFSSVVLSDYQRVFAARRTSLSLVYGCDMPPAEALPLSTEERRALLAWFVCGAPQN